MWITMLVELSLFGTLATILPSSGSMLRATIFTVFVLQLQAEQISATWTYASLPGSVPAVDVHGSEAIPSPKYLYVLIPANARSTVPSSVSNKQGIICQCGGQMAVLTELALQCAGIM